MNEVGTIQLQLKLDQFAQGIKQIDTLSNSLVKVTTTYKNSFDKLINSNLAFNNSVGNLKKDVENSLSSVQKGGQIFKNYGSGLDYAQRQQLIYNDSINSFGKSLDTMGQKISQSGRNMQWLGQRLTFSLSLPLYLFGEQAIKTYLEIDKAYAELQRVWDGNAQQLEELKDIGDNLSSTYAQTQKDVAGVFTELSKAGLGKTVEDMEKLSKLSLQTASIFGVDLSTAIGQVKALMLTYGQTIDEAANSINAMNVIADSTAATESGLIEALTRAGSVAKPLNISVKELSASMAVLQAANVTEERAATGLRTIFSRLVTQSGKAKDELSAFGIRMDDLSWKSLNGQQRIEVLSKKFTELKNSGDKVKFENFRSALSTLVGGGRGGYVNELYLLLDDVGKQFDASAGSAGTFATAIQLSSDDMANAATTAKQMNTIFDSNAFKTEQMRIKYQNLQAEIGEKLLPAKLKLLELTSQLIDKFNNLNPALQSNIVQFGIFVAALGPVLSILGAIKQLTGISLSGLGKTLSFIFGPKGIMTLGGAKIGIGGGPFALIIASIAAFILSVKHMIDIKGDLKGFWDYVALAFSGSVGASLVMVNSFKDHKDQIIKIWESVSEWFKSLPEKFSIVWDEIKLGVKNLTEDIKTFLYNWPYMWAFILGYVAAKLWLFVTETIPKWMESLVMWFKGLPQRIYDSLSELIGKIGGAFGIAISWLAINLPVYFSSVLLWFAELPYRIAEKLVNMGKILGEVIKEQIYKIPEYIGNLWAFGVEIVRRIGRAIANAFDKIQGLKEAFMIGWKTAGGPQLHNGGLLHASNGMIIPGASPLRDRVPVMAEQGEGIMSKKAIENLLQNGVTGGGATYNFNVEIKPGLMIATPGETRELARQFYQYAVKDLKVRQGAMA